MLLSAKYICPERGLAELEPPEPQPLGQAARVAETLGRGMDQPNAQHEAETGKRGFL
jgi:hypothetical protein